MALYKFIYLLTYLLTYCYWQCTSLTSREMDTACCTKRSQVMQCYHFMSTVFPHSGTNMRICPRLLISSSAWRNKILQITQTQMPSNNVNFTFNYPYRCCKMDHLHWCRHTGMQTIFLIQKHTFTWCLWKWFWSGEPHRKQTTKTNKTKLTIVYCYHLCNIWPTNWVGRLKNMNFVPHMKLTTT